jgi:hypothetical protein
MPDRAPLPYRPGLLETPAVRPVRISGQYPPPLVPSPATPPPAELPTADRPRVTRYERPRRPAPQHTRHHARHRTRHRAPQPVAARVWAATSAVLAAAGVAAIVVLPTGAPRPARLDVPVVVVAAPATVPATAPAAAAVPMASGALVLPLPASEPVRVQVPALGVTSTIMRLGLERDGSMEVPPGAYPVGWYDRSPTPGETGPAVLAGHVDWEGEPGAFYGLSELLPGDQVVVDRADGTAATFRVDRVEEHDKDAFPTDAVYGDTDTAGLRLITCGGSFDEDTGDYRKNVIVFATLTATT